MDGYAIGLAAEKLVFRFLTAAAVLFPLSLSNYNTITATGMVLKFSKESPPLAIIEDEKILPETDEQPQLILKREPPTRDVRFLGGLNLDKASPNIIQIKKSLGISTEPQHIKIAENKEKAQEAEDNIGGYGEADSFLSELPPALRARAEGVKNLNKIIKEDYKGETFEDRAQNFLTQYKAPGKIEKSQPANEIWKKFANNRVNNPPQKSSPAKEPQKDSLDVGEKGLPVASRETPRQIVIAGNLELTKGLALSPNQKISIFREIAGTKVSEGQAIVAEGRYEIFIDDPDSGVIVAELEQGNQLIGRGEVLIPEVVKNVSQKEDYKKIDVKISPLSEKVKTEVSSAYSYIRPEKLQGAIEKINNILDQNTEILPSSVIVTAEKKDHWGEIVIGSSGQVFSHKLFSDETVSALAEILGIPIDKSQEGIIRGTVKIAGKATEGVQLELLDHVEKKAVYYNAFIPDPTLKQTTSNGEFAFVGLREGNYILKAKYQGKNLSPQVVTVGRGFISQANIDLLPASLAEAFVFDIKTSEMLSAKIGFLGADKSANINGRKLISYSGAMGVQFLEAESEDRNYLKTRLTVDKSEKQVLIPLIPQEWLGELVTKLKYNITPEHALIIGTARQIPYAVELDAEGYNEETKIIYFNSQGQAEAGALQAPAGGGFVAFNVNPGIRSLFVRYHGVKSMKITTMAADESAINIFNSKF